PALRRLVAPGAALGCAGDGTAVGRALHRAPARDRSVLTHGPDAGGGFPAQFVHPGRHALARSRLDPPELQLGLPGLPGLPGFGPFTAGIPPPLPVDDPVLEDRVDAVRPASPHEPGRPAVGPGLNLDRLAVNPVHAVPPSRPRAQ